MKDPEYFNVSMELRQSPWVSKDLGLKGRVQTSNLTASNIPICRFA
jgi:hypothetical protein